MTLTVELLGVLLLVAALFVFGWEGVTKRSLLAGGLFLATLGFLLLFAV